MPLSMAIEAARSIGSPGAGLIGGAVSSIASLIGYLLSQGDEQAARALYEQAAGVYEDLPKELAGQGIQVPEYENFQEQELGPSALEGVQADPAAKSAQYEVLSRLGQLSDGGLSITEQADLNRVRTGTSREANARMQRVLDSYQNRGMANSGAAIAAQLGANQQATDAGAQSAMDVAGDARERAYAALRDRGAMAGDVRRQQYGEDRDRATAMDEISRYNAAARERGAMYRNQQRQQTYQDQLALADRRYNSRRDSADERRRRAQDTRDLWGGVGEGIGYGISAAGGK